MIDLYKWKHFNPKCPTVLTLHNLNAWHTKRLILRKNLLHSLDSYIASRYLQSILEKITTINVVNPTLVSAANEYFPNKNIISIPFSISINSPKISVNKKIRFTVPGTVDRRRRDYETLLDAFEPLYDYYQTFELVFLGKTYDTFDQPFITSFDERVPEKTYNEYLQSSDFIICPIVPETHTINTTTEYYGITKSPNIFDAIKYRKPLIVPDSISIPANIISNTLTYSDSLSLFNIINQFFTEPQKMKEIKEEAISATERFKKEQIRKDLIPWMKKLL